MTRIAYMKTRFGPDAMALVVAATVVIEKYEALGLTLNLRQLYYQFVTENLIPNKVSEYKRLGDIINRARLGGYISWTALEDRTRFVRRNIHRTDPLDALEVARDTYMLDRWENQPWRPEVWIEKDALVGVIQGVCRRLDVPYFSCRGYSSQSEQWRAGMRFKDHAGAGQHPIVFHLGDHDPSGKDMTWDNWKRLNLFAGYDWKEVRARYDKDQAFTQTKFEDGDVVIHRLALNHDQVEEYDPPPNPAKFTDSRVESYVSQYGEASWELDALDPVVIEKLIEDAILAIRDQDLLDEVLDQEDEDRETIDALIDIHRDNLEASE